MFFKVIFAVVLIFISADSSAQQRTNSVCSWGVLTTTDKQTAPDRHCSMYAGFNDFRPDHPKRSQGIAECSSIVTAAISSCSDSDVQCVKARIFPLRDPVCALNQKYQ